MHISTQALWSRCLLIFGSLTVAMGCAKTPEKLYPVEGVVTIGGKQLDGGTIQFEMLEKGTSGKVYTSAGVIGLDGHFRLRTFEHDGAPVGQHRVWVVPDFAAMNDKIGLGVDRMSPIPRKYMLPTTTDLTAEVKAEKNSLTIEIPADR